MPPVNDNFADAVLISGASGSVVANNVGATRETGEPRGPTAGKTVWYKWVAPSNGETVFDTLVLADVSDTTLGIYQGVAVNSLSEIDFNDDDATTRSLCTFTPVAGQTYYIQVGSFDGDEEGDINLRWAVAPPPPDNDDFADAIELVGDSGSVVADNTSATREVGEPRSAIAARTVWYKWTATSNRPVSFDTEIVIGVENTTLGIYQGASVGALSEIAFNDSDFSNDTSRCTFTPTAGQTYYIQVGSNVFTTEKGRINLKWLVSPAPSTNDDFDDALELVGESGQLLANNTLATQETGEPRSEIEHTLWYKWTAPYSGFAVFDTLDGPAGLRTQIAVYRGNSLASLDEIGYDESVGSDEPWRWRTAMKFYAVKGTEYKVQVGTFGSGGNIFLRWQMVLFKKGNPVTVPYDYPYRHPNTNFGEDPITLAQYERWWDFMRKQTVRFAYGDGDNDGANISDRNQWVRLRSFDAWKTDSFVDFEGERMLGLLYSYLEWHGPTPHNRLLRNPQPIAKMWYRTEVQLLDYGEDNITQWLGGFRGESEIVIVDDVTTEPFYENGAQIRFDAGAVGFSPPLTNPTGEFVVSIAGPEGGNETEHAFPLDDYRSQSRWAILSVEDFGDGTGEAKLFVDSVLLATRALEDYAGGIEKLQLQLNNGESDVDLTGRVRLWEYVEGDQPYCGGDLGPCPVSFGPKRELLEMTAVGHGEQEMQQLDAILEKLSDRPVWLPWWRDQQTLPVSLSIGDMVAAVETEGYNFVEGERAIIYRDPYTWEVVTIEALAGGELVFAAGLTKAWRAGTASIMPLKDATLIGALDLRRGSAQIAEVNVAFAVTPTAIREGTETLYRGVEIITKRADRVFDATESADAINATLESKAGTFAIFAASRGARWNKTFLWSCFSRAEVAELESFIARRAGRYAPFWSPTWSLDLKLVTDASIGDHEITVLSSEFVQSEKHVAIITPNGIYPFAIRDVVDNGNGTMTLRLWDNDDDAGLTEDLNKNAVMISFLKFVRPADDDVVIEFSAGGMCQASLPLFDLPDEMP